MAKFSIGNGQPPALLPSTLPQVRNPPRTSQVRTKSPISTQVHSPIDATESSVGENKTNTEGLRHQVKAGMLKLEQAYYGPQEGAESSLLKLMAPAPTEQEAVADHVLTRQSKLFAKDLGLTQEESRALVADLALVLA